MQLMDKALEKKLAERVVSYGKKPKVVMVIGRPAYMAPKDFSQIRVEVYVDKIPEDYWLYDLLTYGDKIFLLSVHYFQFKVLKTSKNLEADELIIHDPKNVGRRIVKPRKWKKFKLYDDPLVTFRWDFQMFLFLIFRLVNTHKNGPLIKEFNACILLRRYCAKFLKMYNLTPNEIKVTPFKPDWKEVTELCMNTYTFLRGNNVHKNYKDKVFEDLFVNKTNSLFKKLEKDFLD